MDHRSHSRHPARPGILAGALVTSLVVNAVASIGFGHVVQGGEGELLDPEGRFDAFEVLAVTPDEAPDAAADREVRQMISLAPPPDDEAERPDEADFADRFDRTVDEDTVNPDDVFVPEATEVEPGQARVEGAGGRSPSRPAPTPPQPESATTPEDPPPPDAVARLMVPRPVDETAGDARPAVDPADGRADEGRDGAVDGLVTPPLNLAAFRPSAGDIGALPGGDVGTRRNDYLALPEGERTQVNALRSMYWSFFDRVQNRLAQEWDPRSVLRVQDPSGLLYGRQDRLTTLSVTLESDGRLRHAIIDRSCGLDFLDAEAVRAFEAAAPFPNVPEGLKDERGRATFRFGFHVAYGRSPVIRRLDH